MELSRRLFLELLGLTSVSCLTGCRREESNTGSPAPTVSAISDTTRYSLEQLLTEKDLPPQNYKGFPALVNEAGFQVLPMVDKKSERQVVIFAEDHTEEKAKQISNLIDILISRYGFDFIGLEMLYGDPSPSMLETVKRDIRATVGNTFLRGQENGITYEMELLSNDFSPQYDKYARQQSVPTYGIEEKKLFLDVAVLQTYVHGLENLQKIILRSKNVSRTPPSDAIAQIYKLLEDLRHNHRDIDLPEICPYDFMVEGTFKLEQYNLSHTAFHQQIGVSCGAVPTSVVSWNDFDQHRQSLQGEFTKLTEVTLRSHKHEYRNRAMAENIRRYMEKSNSKKGIITVGEAHVFGRLRGIMDTVTTIPALIPYTSVAINATDHPL